MTERHANPEDFDLYALGALDGEEKLTLEAHAGACSVCEQELAAARRRAMLLGLAAAPLTPRPEVKSALMQRVSAERRAGVRQTIDLPAHRKSWGLRLSLGFAAAVLILALATSWLWKQNQQGRQQIAQMQAQLEAARVKAQHDGQNMRALSDVVAAPDTVQVTLLEQAGGPPGQAHVLYNARLGMVVYSGEIAPAPSGKSYQLWLVPSSGAPVNAGVLAENQQDGAMVVHLEQGLGAKAFAVTLEPLGGRPQPTGPKVLVGGVSL
jgi:anti-sigma-K factor RskA